MLNRLRLLLVLPLAKTDMMRKFFLALVIIIGCLGINLPSAGAVPTVSADAYCLYDRDAEQVLWGKKIHDQRPPASTTKMMTAILTRAYCNFDDRVTISEKADRTGGTAIGARKGQVWRVEDLLKAAMARSANDACVALAENIAGSEDLFGMLMTKKAAVIGARESNFINASGLPAKHHYSSAYDLARIGAVLQRDSYLRKLVASKRVDIYHPGYPQGLTLNNTNRLLSSYLGANGIKTGTTDAAGHCLVASAHRQGRNLIAVVLHSNDRYRDSKELLDYGYQSTHLVKILSSREPYKYVRVENGNQHKVAVNIADDINVLMDSEDKRSLQQQVTLDYYPQAPIAKGQKLGQLFVFYCGERIGEVPLLASEQVTTLKNSIIKKVFLPWWK